MKHLLTLAFFLVLGLAAVAQPTNKKNANAAKEVEALERQRFEAQVKKDYVFLEKALADDLVYTHGSGLQNNKTEYLQSMREGKSQYDKIDVEALNVRAYNDGKTAVVNGTILITTQSAQPGGSPNVARIKYVVVQVKNKQGWQVVLWQAQKQAS